MTIVYCTAYTNRQISCGETISFQLVSVSISRRHSVAIPDCLSQRRYPAVQAVSATPKANLIRITNNKKKIYEKV
jgi:hypothetical protein